MPEVEVVRANITEEERERRIKKLEETLSRFLKCKITIRPKPKS